MLGRLVAVCLRHKLPVTVIWLLIACSGVYFLYRLPLDAFPDTTPVMVQVYTIAPTLTPEEVESQLTYPLEQTLSGLPGLVEVRSQSKFGYSRVQVVFEDGTDMLAARQLVAERIQDVQLPDVPGLQGPMLAPITTALGEVYQYALVSPVRSPLELRTLHDWVVKPLLRGVSGVAEVNSFGGFAQQYHVEVDPERLFAHGLTMGDVFRALERNNATAGGGYIESGGTLTLVHGIGLVQEVTDIESIVIRAAEGVPIRIGDVADVRIGYELRRGAVTLDGRGETVLGVAFMLMGENSRTVTERIRERMKAVRLALPPDVEVIELYARTDLVNAVLRTAAHNLVMGAVLVLAALFLLGGSLRAGLIVALAIPLSFLFAGNGMWLLGVAGSLMSLGAIDFGVIVDSSVIVVENAMRRMHLSGGAVGKDDVVEEATVEVLRPALFAQSILMLVYVPVLLLSGTEGKMYRPMAITVLLALGGALLASLTLMPVLASLFLRHDLGEEADPLIIRLLKKVYGATLRLVLSRPVPFATAAVVAGCVALMLALTRGAEFVPTLKEQAVIVNTVRWPGVSLRESIRQATLVERAILERFPDEVAHVWSRTGMGEAATDPMGIEQTDTYIALRPRRFWKRFRSQEEFEEQLREIFSTLPGTDVALTQPIEMLMEDIVAGVRSDVAIKVKGEDLDRLVEYAHQVEKAVRRIPGAADVATQQVTGQPVLRLAVDSDAVARYGIPRETVLNYIAALGGVTVTEVRQGDRRFPLVVRLSEEYRADPAKLLAVNVILPSGQAIPLGALVRAEERGRPSVFEREWGRRRVAVMCNVTGRDVESFVREARRVVEQLQAGWEPGYTVEWGGEFQNLVRARQRLNIVIPIVMIIIFALLYTCFDSARDAFVVFLGVPFAGIGAVVALWLRGLPWSVSAIVGLIAVSGIAVLNGVVLVSTIRQVFQPGRALRDVVHTAALMRLRPVLMTAVTDALGFIPMALATGVGAEVQRPLATVVVGGVISATILTLFLLPLLYCWLGSLRRYESTSVR